MSSSDWPISRRFARRESSSPLNVLLAGGSVRGQCRDISDGGVGAYLAVPIEVGQIVVVEFPSEESPERRTARIVFRQGIRHGMEFLQGEHAMAD